MTIEPSYRRPLGTMIAYGFDKVDLAGELSLAHRLGAAVLEILPDWRTEPDPGLLARQVADAGLRIHSAHGCWGGHSIRADRVDLGHPNRLRRREGVDDLMRCVDWLQAAGGTCLVIHPGGLSSPSDAAIRREALGKSLVQLAEYAHGTQVILCVENMPPGVHPGSKMPDLNALMVELDHPNLALALDTGHAHLSADVESETLAAGRQLRTTHVHDNDGKQDTHVPPGLGRISWESWSSALDAIDYRGPIMLECIRHLRKHPELIQAPLLDLLRRLTTGGKSTDRKEKD